MGVEHYEIKKRIDMDLFARSNIAIAVYFVIFPAILYPFRFYESHPAMGWGITIAIIVVCIFRIIHRLSTRYFYDRFPTLWTGLFCFFVLTHAVILGGFFALVIYDHDFAEILQVSVLLIAGMASGSLSSFSPNLVLSLLYTQVLLMPAIITSYITDPSYVYAIVMLIYLIYLNVLSVLTHREYMRTFDIEAQLEHQKKELETLSRTDSLTGIYNRGYFNNIYEMQWDAGVRNNIGLTVMMIDIDHFKQVNDQYGHPSGDQCLKVVANILNDCIKCKTGVVSRFGGEEFAILLSGTPIHEAEKIAEKMRHQIAETWIEYDTYRFRVTASIGLSNILPVINLEAKILIDQADQALYRAKRSGRNCVRTFN